MIKNVFATLMLFMALAFISACSSDEEQESGFRYNPTSGIGQISWITPNSVAIKAGQRSIVLLSSEKSILEDVEKAYNTAMNSDTRTVFWAEFDDTDHIKGYLFCGLNPSTTYYYITLVYDNVGEYLITPKGLSAQNYEINYVDGTLTVIARPLNNGDVTITLGTTT